MTQAPALPLVRYWLASGEAVRAREATIDPPDWPFHTVATVAIATDDEAFAMLGKDAIDGRGLALEDAVDRAGGPADDAAYVQIVETAVRDFVAGLALFADRLVRERPALGSSTMFRLGAAAMELAEDDRHLSPAACWIRADRLTDFLAIDGDLQDRIAAFREQVGDDALDDRLILGAWCAPADDPPQDAILQAKAAAALREADRARYEKRRTQRANRILRERNERLKAERSVPERRGFLARLFRR